jgi:hypothetical protein
MFRAPDGSYAMIRTFIFPQQELVFSDSLRSTQLHHYVHVPEDLLNYSVCAIALHFSKFNVRQHVHTTKM